MSKLRKALQRAREGRTSEVVPSASEAAEIVVRRELEDRPQAKKPPNSSALLRRRAVAEQVEEVRPEYWNTRVDRADPDVMRQNKVMTVCTEWDVSDHLKILRTQVLNRTAQLKGNSLLVTSANPREGKTFTATNLAVSIAQELDRTCLLVDADLRNPSVHERFGLSNRAGLSDYLLRTAEISDLLVNPGIAKLTILPGGNPILNSSEMLGAPRMEKLVRELKERYPERFIVFDTSSVLTCADPLVFSQFVDGVLLVVEAEQTSRSDLQSSLEMLTGRPLVGVVYNKANS